MPNPASAPKPHAQHHAQPSQRAQHGQTPRPTPRPTQPARPARPTQPARPAQPNPTPNPPSAPSTAKPHAQPTARPTPRPTQPARPALPNPRPNPAQRAQQGQIRAQPSPARPAACPVYFFLRENPQQVNLFGEKTVILRWVLFLIEFMLIPTAALKFYSLVSLVSHLGHLCAAEREQIWVIRMRGMKHVCAAAYHAHPPNPCVIRTVRARTVA